MGVIPHGNDNQPSGTYSNEAIRFSSRLSRYILAAIGQKCHVLVCLQPLALQLAAPHTVESLAIEIGMSRSTFADRFSQVFDQSPIEFVLRVRLRLGAHLLTTTDLPIKIIANSVGYESRSYFSRAFRATYGSDPRTYRAVGGFAEEEPQPIERPRRLIASPMTATEVAKTSSPTVGAGCRPDRMRARRLHLLIRLNLCGSPDQASAVEPAIDIARMCWRAR